MDLFSDFCNRFRLVYHNLIKYCQMPIPVRKYGEPITENVFFFVLTCDFSCSGECHITSSEWSSVGNWWLRTTVGLLVGHWSSPLPKGGGEGGGDT